MTRSPEYSQWRVPPPSPSHGQFSSHGDVVPHGLRSRGASTVAPRFIDTANPWGIDEESAADLPLELVQTALPHNARDASAEIPHPALELLGAWAAARPWQAPRLWSVLVACAVSVLVLPTVLMNGSDGSDANVPVLAAAGRGTSPQIGSGSDSAANPSTAQGGAGAPSTSVSTDGIISGSLGRFGGDGNNVWGDGSVPTDPPAATTVLDTAMCARPKAGTSDAVRCGTGWMSTPAIIDIDGRDALVFGGADEKIHVIDANEMTDLRTPMPFGSAVLGALATDPDGFGLIYAGGTDGILRVIATDRGSNLESLWQFDLRTQTDGLWANAWTGAPLVVDDHLIIGAGNGRLYSFKLSRAKAADGTARVTPTLEHSLQTWNDDLLSRLPDRRVPITGGAVLVGDTIYVANGGGRVIGWGARDLTSPGSPVVTFRWTAPDSISAPMSSDQAGNLYVSLARERRGATDTDVGAVVKLDPRNVTDPVVWEAAGDADDPVGSVATSTIAASTVVTALDDGRIEGRSTADGALKWSIRLVGPLRSTPIVQGDTMIIGDCDGAVSAYSVGASEPERTWSVRVGGCIESTPIVWAGSVVVGATDGFVYRLHDSVG